MPIAPVLTYSAKRLDPLFPMHARQTPVALLGATPSAIYAAGTVLGEVAATPGLYRPYAQGASDGSQNAKMLLRYPVTVDVNGNIGGVGDFSVTYPVTPAFLAGVFRIQDLTGMDANALTQMAGSIKEGILGGSEVDTITISATGGTFAVIIDGTGTTGAIAYNATAATVAAAINAAYGTTAQPSVALVTGSAGGPFTVTLIGAFGGAAHVITTNASLLTGGAGTAVVARTAAGVVGSGILQIG